MDRARTRWCKTFGNDPIDMATGRMILPQTDITLPGSLPLSFTRTFESSHRTGRWFGPTWMSTVDQRLEIDSEGVILIGEEGNFLLYPHPAVGVPTVPVEGEGRPLERTPDGDYVLTDPATGMRWYFTTYTDGLAVLDEISDRHGNHHTFDYTEDGTPTAITHSAGYRLLLTTDEGRITALHLAGAAPDGSDQLLMTYGYDDAGNLITTTNSSGLPLRFTYDEVGRITSWTDTNNSSYTYVYDDDDRCTSQGGIEGHLRAHFTWGDPGSRNGPAYQPVPQLPGRRYPLRGQRTPPDRRGDRPHWCHHPYGPRCQAPHPLHQRPLGPHHPLHVRRRGPPGERHPPRRQLLHHHLRH